MNVESMIVGQHMKDGTYVMLYHASCEIPVEILIVICY